jgi:hypothetical protein
MAGDDLMALLSAHAMPAQINPLWDHVYVASDIGHEWGCFGRNSGGTMICSGDGDAYFANCLSYPRASNSLGVYLYAAITWGVDGVCHQAANRILYPIGNGGLIVAVARGYWLSSTLYDDYGLGTLVPWPRVTHCANLHMVQGVGGSSLGGPSVARKDQKNTQLATTIQEIHANVDLNGNEDAVTRAKLEALARVQLGEDFDSTKVAKIAEYRSWWREQQRALGSQLARGQIDQQTFIASLKNLTQQMAKQCVNVLGESDFERLFGVPAQAASDLFSA